MRKDKLVALIKRRLSGNEFKFHPRLIEANIELAFGEILYNLFRKDISNFDLYTKTYQDNTIEEDVAQAIYYVDLPVEIMQTPAVGSGVRGVMREKENTSVTFVPLKVGASQVFAGLEVDKVTDVIGYKVTNGRVEFDKGMTDTIVDKMVTVRIDAIPTFSEYDDDDEVPIPLGQDFNFVAKVVEFLLGMPEDKMVNDNNPNTP